MLTPIWQLIHARQPYVLLRLVGRGLFTFEAGEQVIVRLSDSAERLMRHDAHRRARGRWRQVRWE